GVRDGVRDVEQGELIGFAGEAKRWKASPRRASGGAKASAIRWLEKLDAGGGTEMRTGIAEALRPLRTNAQRQIVLITDGEIGFESEIVGMIVRELPASC